MSYMYRRRRRRELGPRTTVSVRLTESELRMLGELGHALRRQQLSETKSQLIRSQIERRPISRSETLRRAIKIALEGTS